jgi:uncharacterized membrane protein
MAEQRAAPRTVAVVSLGFSVLGLILSAYLTYTHFSSTRILACPETSFVNCAAVTSSAQSELFGVIPVALAGLLYFAGMTALCVPAAWRHPARAVHRLRLAGATAGAVMVVYLVFVEFHQLHALCLYCTGVHAAAAALFVTVAYGEALRSSPLPAPATRSRVPSPGRV